MTTTLEKMNAADIRAKSKEELVELAIAFGIEDETKLLQGRPGFSFDGREDHESLWPLILGLVGEGSGKHKVALVHDDHVILEESGALLPVFDEGG